MFAARMIPDKTRDRGEDSKVRATEMVRSMQLQGSSRFCFEGGPFLHHSRQQKEKISKCALGRPGCPPLRITGLLSIHQSALIIVDSY